MSCKENAQKGEEGAKQADFGRGCGTAGCREQVCEVVEVQRFWSSAPRRSQLLSSD